MFDVFYYGSKPDLFAFEQSAMNIADAASKAKTGYFWFIYGGNDYTGFDFSWRPAPWEKNQVHVWPSQHQRNGNVFLAHVDSYMNREWHFRTEQSVRSLPNPEGWTIPSNIDPLSVDTSWHPDSLEDSYTYHFPSQHQSASGVIKHGWLQDIKLSDAFVVTALPTTDNWTVPETVNANDIDFSWHPNAIDPSYVYHFGSEWQETTGLIYTAPGATEIKLMGPAPSKTGHVMQTPAVFFIDHNNPLAQSRIAGLKDLGVEVIVTRYFGSTFETVKRCARKSPTTMFWVISSENDYEEFNFTWHPNTWQQYMTHVFGSKWNKWTDTFLINKYEFERHSTWANSIEQFPNLNFVTDQLVATSDDSSAMYYVDHGNPESVEQFANLKQRYPNIRSTRFVDNYLDTFKRIVSTATTDYIWILSSLCNYADFDFTWQPGAWEREQIHCFCNERAYWDEKRGDTFYIPVEIFKAQMYELELLDWFNVINYNSSMMIHRWSVPVVEYEDNLVQAIKDHEFTTPYAVFANREFSDRDEVVDCMWTEKDRTVRSMSRSNGICVIPRDIKKHIKTQVYDYPYLYKESDNRLNCYADIPMDVVYISNGEPDAEHWYEHLSTILNKRIPGIGLQEYDNKLHRVQNVNGRVAAYQAAARASTTPWFFAVFAKLEVVKNFNFDWQPDLWQEPKHYIFNARNPVNGLEYGHMGMIAYNKKLVLENNNPGIDFTLSQPHESVPILSGTAHFNQDPWTTWRTAFREALKLRMFMDTQPTLETEHRLDQWLNRAEGKHSYHSLVGARAAVEYYEKVDGDPAKLQLSFEWAWLRNLFDAKYSNAST